MDSNSLKDRNDSKAVKLPPMECGNCKSAPPRLRGLVTFHNVTPDRAIGLVNHGVDPTNLTCSYLRRAPVAVCSCCVYDGDGEG